MKTKKRLIKKEEKDGVIKVVTEVEEDKTYRIQEYYNRDTGSFGIDTFDEEGNIVSGVGGHVPDIVMSMLKDRD